MLKLPNEELQLVVNFNRSLSQRSAEFGLNWDGPNRKLLYHPSSSLKVQQDQQACIVVHCLKGPRAFKSKNYTFLAYDLAFLKSRK